MTLSLEELRERVGQAESNMLSVRMELQADCFAGVWARRAHEARGILERGDVAGVLVNESRDSSLVVLGKRGLHGLRGRLGSVSAATAAHAECPVIVLPETIEPTQGDFTGRVVVAVDKLGLESPSVRKAAEYAQAHGDAFGRIEAVAEIDGQLRVLDMKNDVVRASVHAAQDAESLYKAAPAY